MEILIGPTNLQILYNEFYITDSASHHLLKHELSLHRRGEERKEVWREDNKGLLDINKRIYFIS